MTTAPMAINVERKPTSACRLLNTQNNRENPLQLCKLNMPPEVAIGHALHDEHNARNNQKSHWEDFED